MHVHVIYSENSGVEIGLCQWNALVLFCEQDSSNQLPLEDLEKLLQFMKAHGLTKRLVEVVNNFSQ